MERRYRKCECCGSTIAETTISRQRTIVTFCCGHVVQINYDTTLEILSGCTANEIDETLKRDLLTTNTED